MSTAFERELGSRLVVAIERDRRRRRRVRRGVAAAVAALVAGVATLVLPDPAAADVEVRVRDGQLEVTLVGLSTRPDEVVVALREHGVDATVELVPTGPSQVGRFTSVYVAGDVGASAQLDGEEAGAYRGFTVPEHPGGAVIVFLGRAADPGEVYEAAADAFAPREPLHCAGVFGTRLADAAGPLSDIATVSVVPVQGGIRLGEQTLLAAVADHGDWFVAGGDAKAASDLRLEVQPAPPGPEPGC